MDDAAAVSRETEAEAERDLVSVACGVPGGLVLQMTAPIDDGTGHPQMRRVGPQVLLTGPRPGMAYEVAAIDAAFWAQWSEQNAQNPLLVDGTVRLEDRQEEDEERRGP